MDLEDYEEEVMVTMTENTTSSGSSPLPQNMSQEDIDFQQDLETLMTIGTMSTHNHNKSALWILSFDNCFIWILSFLVGLRAFHQKFFAWVPLLLIIL